MRFVIKKEDDCELIECLIKDKCVGYITYKYLKNSVWLYKVKVEKQFRSQGIGTLLLRLFENESISNYKRCVEGKFFPEDEKGDVVKHFYKVNGYSISKEGYETEIYKLLDKKHDLSNINIEYINLYSR